MFCPACGARQSATAGPPGARAGWFASSRQRIAGVCAGLADYVNVDVTLVRAAWIVLSIVPGAIGGILAYLLAWMVMPEGQPTRRDRSPARAFGDRRKNRRRRLRRSRRAGVDATPVRVGWIVLSVFPGAVVCG